MENETHVSPQKAIETEMKFAIDSQHVEMAHLYSDEGLLLAEVSEPSPIDRDSLIEITLHFQELLKIADVMGNVLDLKEIILEGEKGRKLVFRFFAAFDQPVVLALVVPPKKTYRKYANRLVRLVKKVSK